ncbi:ribonuclease Z [Marinobacterium lutimaris]|uniref:Ribonuclease Z n=1 Tax=Marinobacterium lutimaris TaxID=568106 RepID=A0A1H6D9H7_9GAMM|nr:ribonuclease Z [Marinobacterium lutimaris]SEG82021.1 RNAse Z [Marinobacterium lutimaris]
MKITFLGTSSGSPTKQRNLSATAVQPETGKPWILVDCGEATQHRLLHTPLSPHRLETILITHIHGDHCYGLPGLLASCQLTGRTAPLTLIGPRQAWEFIDAVIRTTELYLEYPLEFIEVSEALCHEAAGFRVTASPLSHRTQCWGYRVEELDVPLQLDVERLHAEGVAAGPAYASLQRGEDVQLDDGRTLLSADYTQLSRKPRVVVIAGDNDTPECLSAACDQADLLIHEATYTEEVLQQVGPEPQHSSAQRVASFAEQAGIPNLLLTHFSPRYAFASKRPPAKRSGGHRISEIRDEARQHYSGHLELAEDLDRWLLSRQGMLLPL